MKGRDGQIRQFSEGDDPAPVLALIREAFAYMDGVIDPPSSMHRLTPADIARQAETGEVWLTGPKHAPTACLFLTRKPDALYLGKLAVAEPARGRGLARRLVELAEARARALGFSVLELQTRVELTGNHATFERLGFTRTGATAHAGYDRPTSYTYRKPVSPPGRG
ncbi:MAG: GNAT family N-acetyltransferase [Maritimibacter sp.]|nr:GNAT family N-acetyltransferase [Maritimibacter sp.]